MPPLDGLKERAKAEGLWNLFLPGLREDEPGTRLSNLEYAPLAEMMDRLPWCSEVFNCSAPVHVPVSNLLGERRHSTSNASIVGALRQ
jgi:hypothetical protein